jgi:hypothetical protein
MVNERLQKDSRCWFWSYGFFAGLPDFSWYNTPKRPNVPKGWEIYQMAIQYANWPEN